MTANAWIHVFIVVTFANLGLDMGAMYNGLPRFLGRKLLNGEGRGSTSGHRIGKKLLKFTESIFIGASVSEK